MSGVDAPRCPDIVAAHVNSPTTTPDSESIDWSAVPIPVVTTVLSILGLFMVGTLAVDIRADLGFSEVALGGLVTAFSVVTAATSMPIGGVVERLGYRRSLAAAATLTGVSMIAVGSGGRSWWPVALAMSLGGLGAAAAHPAANLALTRCIPATHQGLALGIKQASIPAAIFIAGLAVPVLGETVGWRWAFRGGGLAAAWLREEVTIPTARVRGFLRAGPLLLLTGVVFFGVTGVQALAIFLVEAAVAEGFSAASTGIVLSVASLLGIAARIVSGWKADRSNATWALSAVTVYLVAGTSGFVLLAMSGSFALLAVGAFIGLGAGWSWNGLVHFAVVRHYAGSPATATGVLLVGAFGGGAVGPLVFGAVVVNAGYPQAWLFAGASMLVGAGLAALARRMVGDAGPTRPG